jgi:cysteine desulfurase / selenocysteine lyase
MSAPTNNAVLDRALTSAQIRARFPGLSSKVHGKDLIYLDSANTAQKFDTAIAAGLAYYTDYAANVFRAVHSHGERATLEFEGARDCVQHLINAPDRSEIIFTSGTTAAINLLAYSFGARFQADDVILLTELEHHANIVPWQLLAARTGARIEVVPVFDDGTLDLDAARSLLAGRVKLFAFTHISNALGTINPVQALCAMAKEFGVPTLIDGSQAAPHMAIDVQSIGCDFYVFTGHKLFGPTGTGVLWGKRAHLEQMPPFMGGGEMIEHVSFAGTTFNVLPNKFEAGTPNIAGFIGLKAAISAMLEIGLAQISAIESKLAAYAYQRLQAIDGLKLLGPELESRAPVFSFVLAGAHAHDLAMLLDQDGIAIRSGQHCAHPLMQRLGVSATARASLAFYNTEAEVDFFIQALEKARRMLI